MQLFLKLDYCNLAHVMFRAVLCQYADSYVDISGDSCLGPASFELSERLVFR